MALDGTYAGLQSSIADFLNRSDLTATIVDFIKLTETQLDRRLRTSDMMSATTLTLTASATQNALPTDFNGVVSFELPSGTGAPLRYERPEGVRAQRQSNYATPGTPILWTIIGAFLETAPVAGSNLVCPFVYFQRIPALSASNTTNWLLTKHPDLYLYGSLLQAAPYLKDDPRVAVWGQLFLSAIQDTLASDARAAYTHGLIPAMRGAAAPQGTEALPGPPLAPPEGQ